MKIKTILTMVAFGASALAANASLFLNKIDVDNRVNGESLKNYSLPSASWLQAFKENQDGKVNADKIANSHSYRFSFNFKRKHPVRPVTTVPVTILDPGLASIDGGSEQATTVIVSERVAIAVVPEPTTIFAGAMLLLPLGMSAGRILWLNKKRGNQNG